MTRETKIGLLVGLAFIIVIGILIADYSADSMKRPQAPVEKAMQNVLEGANSPGARRQVVSPPPAVREPARPIGDSPRGSAEVGVLPPEGVRVRDVRNDSPVEGTVRVARGGGVTLDPVPDRPDARVDSTERGARNPAPTPTMKEVVASKGDTVYALVSKHVGSTAPEVIEAFFKANPELNHNAKALQVGKTYKIPGAVNTPAPAVRTERDSTPTPPPPPATPPAGRDARPEAPVRVVMYTTKPGDSLWKIATYQCGGGSQETVAKIKEMNKDQLTHGDALQPQMTLKLPAKGT